MAQDERSPVTEPAEERLRRRIRAVAAYTLLGLIVVLALADTFGGSLDVHAGPFVFGTVVGAFLLVIGVEAGSRFLGR